jgi:CheY-like chemotaxis protein
VFAESGNDEYRWIRRIIGYGVASATGYVRVSENVHWLSDSVAGAALGIATARFVLSRQGAQDRALQFQPVKNGWLISRTPQGRWFPSPHRVRPEQPPTEERAGLPPPPVFQLKRFLGPLTSNGAVPSGLFLVRPWPRLAAAQRNRNTMDIVIYEEDHLTCALLQQWLGEAGYRVHVGMPCGNNLDGPADLVIANVYMPKHGGARSIRSIREAHPNIPVIAISGQFRPGLSAAGATAQTLGVEKVIAKPLLRSELVNAVRGLLSISD